MDTSRRNFLKGAIVAALAASLPAGLQAPGFDAQFSHHFESKAGQHYLRGCVTAHNTKYFCSIGLGRDEPTDADIDFVKRVINWELDRLLAV